MAARPRIRRRANWPENLHEPRPGYYVWRNPVTKKTLSLGYVPVEQAIFEVLEANAKAKEIVPTKRLVERMEDGEETIADLLLKMPNTGVKPATIAARKHQDKAIRATLGHIKCSALTTKHVADMLEAIEARGKMQWAVHIRSRMKAVCRRGMALGWMEKNPAEATDKAKVKVKRKRMTMEVFKAALAKAPEVAPWLENAMLLALVSGQALSTVGRWERTSVKGGEAIVTRAKTDVSIAIPLALRMDAIGYSLEEVIVRCKSTGVVSKYLIHHIRGNVMAPRGSAIKLKTISEKFLEARRLAGYTAEDEPTFHEIRSLSKRTYMEQGGVDTKALLGHLTEAMAELYANSRGLEPMKVKINGA
ncbi:phage integrase Arm DNA-binding domain-containing protein [Paraburkholderia bengalensis]|uniref:Phage integrase Arm DNA-binding domain-containing protein n=1 Tax=Paraburkholderia bengalensis TaxID=2747562 RepID=A0ABU8IS82_9BURK